MLFIHISKSIISNINNYFPNYLGSWLLLTRSSSRSSWCNTSKLQHYFLFYFLQYLHQYSIIIDSILLLELCHFPILCFISDLDLLTCEIHPCFFLDLINNPHMFLIDSLFLHRIKPNRWLLFDIHHVEIILQVLYNQLIFDTSRYPHILLYFCYFFLNVFKLLQLILIFLNIL